MTAQKDTPEALAGATGAQQKTTNPERKIPQSSSTHKNVTENTVGPAPEPPRPLPWSPFFRVGHDGIYKAEVQEDGSFKDIWLFSPLIVEAFTRDAHSQNWGLLLTVIAQDGTRNQWAMPMQFLGGSGSAYREVLLSLGLRMAQGAQKHLHAYLATAKPSRLLRCVQTIGWHNGVYVLPDTSYGPEAEGVTLQTGSTDTLFRCKGSLEEWQKRIGWYCLGNSRLTFATCAAVAAVLLRPCGLEGGGVHFLGSSSIGKSVLLLVAGSVCGGGGPNGFLRRWRATDNALESVALAHNDALLCLDEIGQLPPRIAAEVSYMLANGQGKARATKDGTIRALAEWLLLFLSSGEMSLGQKIQEDGQRHMAGQAVRVLDIAADAGAGHGIFENLHDFPDGKAFAEHLQQAAVSVYGTPLRAFLANFAHDLPAMRARIRSLMQDCEQKLCHGGAGGQVNRAAKRFALFAAAGELATAVKVFPWPEGAAFAAAKRCFQDWIAFRGGLGAAEAREILRRACAFIESYRTSRFEPWERGEPCTTVNNSAGFCREKNGKLEYLFYRHVFVDELCAGLPPKTCAHYLMEAGFMPMDDKGNPPQTHSPPRLKTSTRLYTIREDILNYEDTCL